MYLKTISYKQKLFLSRRLWTCAFLLRQRLRKLVQFERIHNSVVNVDNTPSQTVTFFVHDVIIYFYESYSRGRKIWSGHCWFILQLCYSLSQLMNFSRTGSTGSSHSAEDKHMNPNKPPHFNSWDTVSNLWALINWHILLSHTSLFCWHTKPQVQYFR